jgi:hypothetical protein
MRICARDDGAPGFQRLAQRLQRAALEFRQLVEEEHAAMGEADLARPAARATADQRRDARGMMGVAERARGDEAAAMQEPRERMDHRDLQRLGGRERRQQPRQAAREHRLAGARRADEKQVVAACRRDLERAPGPLLALHVREVGEIDAARGRERRRRAETLHAPEVVHHGDEARRRDDLRRARPRGLGTALRRADDAAAGLRGGDRRGQHARHRAQAAIEGELAHRREAREEAGIEDPARHHQRQRDRQVVVAALLVEVGGREVDGDAARGKREADRRQRGAHALAALRDGLVGQSDQQEGGQPAAEMDLHVDIDDVDAGEGDRRRARMHGRASVPGRRDRAASPRGRGARLGSSGGVVRKQGAEAQPRIAFAIS